MKTWTKEEALSEIDDLIGDIHKVSSAGRLSAAHTRWVMRAHKFFKEVFGRNSRLYIEFSALSWSATGGFVSGLDDLDFQIERQHQRAFTEQLEVARGLLQAAHDELDSSTIDEIYEGKDTPEESSLLLKVINLAEHKLRKVIRDIPKDEKEVQDAFENLLIGADIRYSREKDSIEYSSKTYKPDFTIDQLELAIEIKLCKDEGRVKKIIPEINDDILAYQTKYRNLLFVVYDVGKIRDKETFSASFEAHDNVIVRIVKH